MEDKFVTWIHCGERKSQQRQVAVYVISGHQNNSFFNWVSSVGDKTEAVWYGG